MTKQNVDFGMTITVDAEQEITLNFMDITSITKKSVTHNEEDGKDYLMISVSFTRKSSTTIPMVESDYQTLKRKYHEFLNYMMEHPENQQLRSINAAISKNLGDIINQSVQSYFDVQNQVSDNINAIQEAFENRMMEYCQQFIQNAEQTQKQLDEKLKSVDELYQKLHNVNNLVEDFLVAESRVDEAESETESGDTNYG